VNLLLPLAGNIPRWTAEGPSAVEPVVYGTLADCTLREILDGDERRRFTAPFEARLAAEGRFRREVGDLWSSHALTRFEEADRAREEEVSRHPLPRQCAGCHKAMGW
jgi:hypothetical protein